MSNPYENSNRPYSSQVVDGDDRAPSRAMLYAVGFEKEDFQKPQVAIASLLRELMPQEGSHLRLVRLPFPMVSLWEQKE